MYYNAKNFFPLMKDRKIDVIGFGVSNSELLFRLVHSGAQVTLHDSRTEDQFRPEQIERLKKAHVELSLGQNYLEDLNGEIIFRTPGLPFTTAQLTRARERGKIVTSELEVFIRLCPCPIYGVTGSDGKTTTSSILAEMLRRSGKVVHLGGNIGKPLLPILDMVSENDLCVIELSSFQLLSMRCSPDVAVVTNISPNHLDVHKDMAEYVGAKRNIVRHQSAFSRAVLSADSAGAEAFMDEVRGPLAFFSRQRPVQNGAWMDGKGDLYHSVGGRAAFLMNRSEIKLPGLHNVENVLAAISAAWGAVTPKQICDAARTFGGVEHRIEFVRLKDGVRWYNDSIATSPTRTVAGLMSFEEKLILIAGGYDKKIPFEPLTRPVLSRVKLLILTGPTADKIEQAVTDADGFKASGLKIIRAKDLADAVAQANAHAKFGDVVTLSPACASFDAFSNFEERGNFYKKLVNAL
ncbi:UDP-N-acetylmuramoyl-L-alanine--D-glutamate ligase [Oscillospiraceae bacterium LTW-04]|nr:UDP-N-acetylmuramoyl-L-alanine--D-glutamate ligase [Oscillospiraceae bacterium MB24-C1]